MGTKLSLEPKTKASSTIVEKVDMGQDLGIIDLHFYAAFYHSYHAALTITHAHCVGILNHIEKNCIDHKTEVVPITAGGIVISRDGRLHANLKFGFRINE